MVIRLNDKIKINISVLRQKWLKVEKNDPYLFVSKLFKEKKYNKNAAIVEINKNTNIRYLLAIPTVLLLVFNIDYKKFMKAMYKRNKSDIFANYFFIASLIAKDYFISAEQIDEILEIYPIQCKISNTEYDEFKRMYEIYRYEN